MKLLPALKPKKRYIVFEISASFSESEIREEVDKALLLFLGQLGLSKANPMWIKASKRRFIIKVSHKWVNETKAAVALIKTIKNKSVLIHSILTSGTIKKASSYLEVQK